MQRSRRHGTRLRVQRDLGQGAARYSIRVAGIAPGFIETEMTLGMKPEALEKMTSGIALNRMGRPQEIAHSAAYSFENDYYTGRIWNGMAGYAGNPARAPAPLRLLITRPHQNLRCSASCSNRCPSRH